MKTGTVKLIEALENSPNGIEWQTQTAERLFLMGIASLIRPKVCIELGIHKGGFTQYLVDFAEILITVDVEKRFDKLPVTEYPHHQTYFHHLTTDEFFNVAWKDHIQKDRPGLIVDLIVVDASHSLWDSYNDLKNSMKYGKTILMHDTFNPECRSGYERAIRENTENILYHDLDAIRGCVIDGVQWGGVGIVITGR